MKGHLAQIRVRNRNTFAIEDRHDNVRYVFPPDEQVTIPSDVATHIFGYSPEATEESMLAHVTRRFGWNRPDIVKDNGHKDIFDNIEIKPVFFRMVPVELVEETGPYPGEDGTRPLGDEKRTVRGRPPGRPRKVELHPKEQPELIDGGHEGEEPPAAASA